MKKSLPIKKEKKEKEGKKEKRRRNGIYWKDQKDNLDGVTIPTPYLQQFLHLSGSQIAYRLRQFNIRQIDQFL